MLQSLIVSLYGQTTYSVIHDIFVFYPLWLPIILGVLFIDLWFRFRRAKFIVDQGSVFLEIRIPREISKSPAAMEVVLTSLYQTGSASYAEAYIDGKIRPWFSLELVSLEGKVHFYMWAQKKFKNLIETQIYAQYPEVEVVEAHDYARDFVYDPAKTSLWGTYFKLSEKNSAVPIKTYVDYGLDKDPKEEHKVDPLTAVLEYLSSIGPGEQIWIQILIQAYKKEGLKEGRLFEHDPWKKAAEEEIKKIREKLKTETGPEKRPTKGESDKIAAIERKQGKYPFEAVIRAFYIASTNAFKPINITSLIGSVRQYDAKDLNSFKLGWFTDHPDNFKDFYRYLLKNRGLKSRRRKERRMIEAYKMRSFFQYPYKNFHQDPYILTTEELATMYHFPGEVAQSPNLDRIPSKKGQAPADLPV